LETAGRIIVFLQRVTAMIECIPNLPGHVVGVIASGQVTGSDYETVLIPAIQAALAAHGRVRILYQLGSGFTGFTVGAMWDDMKVGLAHWSAWEKAAVVTDNEWIAGAVRLFALTMPCPVKVFSNKEITEATQWVTAT